MPKKAPSVKDYLKNIDTSLVTSGLWDPAVQWNRLHGDGKSSTGGSYHIETMKGSDERFLAKVVGPGGKAVVNAEWAAGTSPEPTVSEVVTALKNNA